MDTQRHQDVEKPSILFGGKRPVTAEEAASSQDMEERCILDLTGKRVVIVEDEGITQLQLRRLLRKNGLEVVGEAADGREAIEVVLSSRPDLVLMDIKMPVMNGLEASEHILSEYSVCIVMLTAFSDTEYQERAKEIGACGYVVKPITADILLSQVRVALRRFSQR